MKIKVSQRKLMGMYGLLRAKQFGLLQRRQFHCAYYNNLLARLRPRHKLRLFLNYREPQKLEMYRLYRYFHRRHILRAVVLKWTRNLGQ